MLEYIKNEANVTATENGAVTYMSSGSYCLDFFASVGALRGASNDEITERFVRAFAEDRNSAVKLMFYARDVRGGLGERRAFRVCLEWLANNAADTVLRNIENIAEYGRFDDVLVLLDTPLCCEAAAYIKAQLERDITALKSDGEVSLLAKWLPSCNASSAKTVCLAKKLVRMLGMTDAEYRRILTALRSRIGIIENNLRERDYSFDYSKQPSKAMLKYRKAFIRNDSERYSAFLERVISGEEILHADTLAPYEIISPVTDRYCATGGSVTVPEAEAAVLDASWRSLPDYTCGRNMLAVIDTSGSMYSWKSPTPASVALSLGLYFAEHSTGAFAGYFIEFSETPRLIEIKGKTLVERLQYLMSFNEVANTDIEAVFDLVLSAAVKNNVPQAQLPESLVIISDMEFDSCAENADMTNFENAKAKFAATGYKLPTVVFWNVASRSRQAPVKMNDVGALLVSGVTPKLFETVASGAASPFALMCEVIRSERYAGINA